MFLSTTMAGCQVVLFFGEIKCTNNKSAKDLKAYKHITKI